MATRIKVPCPKCGNIATVEIATIDKLKEENERLKNELSVERKRRVALELQKKAGFFGGIFGG